MLKTLGHDTELFGAKDGKIIPLSPDILTGTKEHPQKIGNCCSLQLDNVLCEVTSPPATSASHFSDIMIHGKDQAEKWLMKNHKITAIYDSHHEFELNDVMTPWAMQNGCAPDFTADTEDPVAKLDMTLFTTLKTASGHIHIGVYEPDKWTMTDKIQMVRALDFALGAPLSLMHNDPIRRKLYGKAARFRSKPYGFEYRTPDNYWFGSADPYLYHSIFDVIRHTMSIAPDNRAWSEINQAHSALCDAINAGHKDKIADLMCHNPFYQLDYSRGKKLKKPKKYASKYNIPPIDFSQFNMSSATQPPPMPEDAVEMWPDDEPVDGDENY